MDELYKKLDKIFSNYFPTKEKREKAFADLGQIILFESLEVALLKLKNDADRSTFSEFINSNKPTEADEFLTKKGIDFGEILENKSKEVLVDILK